MIPVDYSAIELLIAVYFGQTTKVIESKSICVFNLFADTRHFGLFKLCDAFRVRVRPRCHHKSDKVCIELTDKVERIGC